MKHEIRNVRGAELRASNDELFQISGVAAAYNTKSADLGGFRERIAPQAFDSSLKAGADVKCTFNHNPDLVLGRTKSGTLLLGSQADGLHFSCKLDKGNSQHNDVFRAIKRGDISDCSFAFTVPDGGDSFEDDEGRKMVLRTLRNVNLIDVSCVTYPAYPQGTSVDARSGAVKIVPQATYDYICCGSAASMTDAQRLARAARLGVLIDADTKRAIAEGAEETKKRDELRQRMDAAAGRTQRA